MDVDLTWFVAFSDVVKTIRCYWLVTNETLFTEHDSR
jgi:hypothetical protein